VEQARNARAPLAGDPGRPARAPQARGAPIRRVPVGAPVATDEDEDADAAPDAVLFERLRALRKRLADERKVPAYVVFSDRTLQAMAAQKPGTADRLLDIPGVGQKKLDEYGDAFLAEISRAGPL
jgi:ATP-dependent DNA helicase RecQ